MSLIESTGFLFSSSFALLTILSIGSFMYRDIQLLLRKGIRYHNYTRKEVYFRLKPSTIQLNVFRFLFLLGTLFSLIYLFTNMVRIYVLIILPFLFLITFFYFQEQAIQKTNLSLHKFDHYYEEIHTLIEKKVFLMKEIQSLQQMLSDKHTRYLAQIEAINQYLQNKLDRSYFLSLTNQIKTKITGYENDLKRFDDSISQKFNALLKTYLQTLRISKGLDVPALVTFVPKDIDQEIQETEDKLTQKIFQDANDWLVNNMVNEESPVKLLNYLSSFQKEIDTLIEKAFEFYHSAQNKDYFLNYLEEKKLIRPDFLFKDVYLKRYHWLISPQLYKNLKTDQILELMKLLLKENFHESGLTMMLTLPLAFRDMLSKILGEEVAQNRTRKLFQIFVDVYKKPLEFYHPTTLLYNQAQAIKHFSEVEDRNPIDNNRVNNLLQSNQLENEKDWLQQTYQQYFNGLVSLKSNAIELLILLQDVTGADDPWFDFGKLISLIYEFHKTLQKDKLMILEVLMVLMIGLKSQSVQVYEKAITICEKELEQFLKVSKKNGRLQIEAHKIQDALKKDYYFHHITAIISRIEQKRQAVDEILSLRVN